MMALELALLHHIAPPEAHGAENANDAGDDAGEAELVAEHRQVVHVEHHADGEEAGRDRADHRPWARIDQVIRVVRLMGCVAHGLHSLPSRPVPLWTRPADKSSSS